MENKPIMVRDKITGSVIPLNEFITRTLNHFKGIKTSIDFDIRLELYEANIKFTIVVES